MYFKLFTANRFKILYGIRSFTFNEASKNDLNCISFILLAFNKRANDLVCPDPQRVPYPEFTEFELGSLQSQFYERSQMEKLNTKLPLAAIYTVLNSKNKFWRDFNRINNACFSEDSSILAVALADSTIKLWSLTFQRLKVLKSLDEIQRVDKSSGDFYERCLTERFSRD